MSEDRTVTAYNLEFFKTAILEPALRYTRREVEDAERACGDLGAVEAAHWAALGAQIEYFEGEDAYQLIADSKEVFGAWANLVNQNVISASEPWAKVVTESGGIYQFRRERFAPEIAGSEIDEGTRQLLQRTFQGYLLVLAESSFDDDTQYFRTSVAWTDDAEWNARRAGMRRSEADPVEKLWTGFANAVTCLEQMREFSDSLTSWEMSLIFGVSPPIAGVSQPAVIERFADQAQMIVSRRFFLSFAQAVDRYFALAGELVGRARQDTAEWLDARPRFFNHLCQIVSYGGGARQVRERREQLWEVFATDNRGAANVASPTQAYEAPSTESHPPSWHAQGETSGEVG